MSLCEMFFCTAPLDILKILLVFFWITDFISKKYFEDIVSVLWLLTHPFELIIFDVPIVPDNPVTIFPTLIILLLIK